MQFLISSTFTDALGRLAAHEQKAVKQTTFDLQVSPSSPGLKLHRIEQSRDPNFWSARVSSDLRIILHRTASSCLLAYVAHHDEAYRWAERRKIEMHPRTGAAQIVEVRERVAELPLVPPSQPVSQPPSARLFDRLTDDNLLAAGVPNEWLADVRSATEETLLDLCEHLPAEAAEGLLELAVGGAPVHAEEPSPEPITRAAEPPLEITAAAFEHPDAQRRFRRIDGAEELEQALRAPWAAWTVFLHPSQRALVERSFTGPARVAGSAGTGKTIVALHRAARLATADPKARVLLTTFSEPLAEALRSKLALLVPSAVAERITVAPWDRAAAELFALMDGMSPAIASEETIAALLVRMAGERGISETPQFLASEWRHVVDAWGIRSADEYTAVPRLGRRNRMGARQRERLWPLFESVRAALQARGQMTGADVMDAVAAYWRTRETKPYSHVVVDEAQDLGPAELRFLSAVAPHAPDALFFAGDLGQRIFRQPFSWRAVGIDLRGRSRTLKICYRTSARIRGAADRLLPKVVRDVDGNEDDRTGAISLFEGVDPDIHVFAGTEAEAKACGAWLKALLDDGLSPNEIAVFARDARLLPRARLAIQASGVDACELLAGQAAPGRIPAGIMHLSKGLEFRAVAIVACDADALPLAERVAAAADEVELDEAFDTERHLFYVACTRARDRLWVSGTKPASEFVGDLGLGR